MVKNQTVQKLVLRPAKVARSMWIYWKSVIGHGDYNSWQKCDGLLAGCADLLNTVEKRVKPKYHIFGHIHQMHGATTNGVTTFLNASICDHKLRPDYDPIIFDLPIPPGHSKDE